ncbi:nucleotidyltransferase domain-containing protein [Rhodothermus marinus]|uniref:nucleotidyltransferase domain-containing protein n=1 Tax=Rhodothermus marinus TaxID=29549 RepID=UPI0006D13EDF|nr:nucleotidyltransferase domain-containing protein [Rhodothermus marinus]
MPALLYPVLTEIKTGLQQHYGSRLRGVYLFGSHARGEAHEASDLDVLVVLDHIGDYLQELYRVEALLSELALRYTLPIHEVLVSESDWETGRTHFLQTVRAEAQPIP